LGYCLWSLRGGTDFGGIAEMNATGHATLQKFGYPETMVAAFDNWAVVARRHQVTLGSLVLIAKSDAGSFATLPRDAYAELEVVTHRIEAALKAFRKFDKINYIMLMMVDPHVHFHVIPRYSAAQNFAGESFADAAWPGPPDLKSGATLDGQMLNNLISQLTTHFNAAD
jgi:diadenosine tetraphosphate (Ap4A) HIT family hydrolase